MRFATKALHHTYPKPEGYGALRFPIYQNAAFEFGSGEEMEAVFTGVQKGHTYTRASNPTTEELESKIKQLSGGYGVVTTASGMAAISTTLLALLQPGDNLVTTTHLFGHTLSLFRTLFPTLGIEVRFVDVCDLDAVRAAIDGRTRALFCESMSNPQLSIPDLAALSETLHAKGALLIVDTTLTPWNILDAKALGVDIEILSATKYLSGGGCVVGGVIIDTGNASWGSVECLSGYYAKFKEGAFISKLRKETYRNLGPALAPQSAYMLSLGLETLDLRVRQSSKNALGLATYLSNHPAIQSVHYPFLASSPYAVIAKRQFVMGGSILTFDLGSKARAYGFLNALKLIKRSTNIHDNRTLAIAPYQTIFAEYTPEQCAQAGLYEGMIRLAVGIEDLQDLIEDCEKALK